jgi:hypothetical protein
LIKLLCKFYEEAKDLLGREGQEISPQIKLFIPVLKEIFAKMGVFEPNNASFACVVPEITDLSAFRERHAHTPNCAEMSNIFMDAIVIIRGNCLCRVNSVFHLADVLAQWDEFRLETSSSDEQ